MAYLAGLRTPSTGGLGPHCGVPAGLVAASVRVATQPPYCCLSSGTEAVSGAGPFLRKELCKQQGQRLRMVSSRPLF